MKLKTLTSAIIWILRGQTKYFTFLYPVTVHVVHVVHVESSPVVNVPGVCLSLPLCSGQKYSGEKTGNNEESHGDHRHDWWLPSVPSSSSPSSQAQPALNYNSMSITQLDYICCSPFPHNIQGVPKKSGISVQRSFYALKWPKIKKSKETDPP